MRYCTCFFFHPIRETEKTNLLLNIPQSLWTMNAWVVCTMPTIPWRIWSWCDVTDLHNKRYDIHPSRVETYAARSLTHTHTHTPLVPGGSFLTNALPLTRVWCYDTEIQHENTAIYKSRQQQIHESINITQTFFLSWAKIRDCIQTLPQLTWNLSPPLSSTSSLSTSLLSLYLSTSSSPSSSSVSKRDLWLTYQRLELVN